MENASKALIIAGAILISILLISLGILIYNQAQSITQSGAVDELAVTQFNEKFTQYEGTKTGAQVRALLSQILSSNANEENADKQITATVTTGNSSMPTIAISGANYTTGNPSGVRTTSKYKVEFTRSTQDNRKGLIESVAVNPV